MGIAEDFKTFCNNISINDANISNRYKQITKRINLDYWNSTSDIYHSKYIGSFLL